MKLIQALLLLTVVSFVVTPVQAQEEEPPIPARPENGNYILDELDWLSADQEANINLAIRKLDEEGIAEIAVVTLNDCGSSKESYRRQLFDAWGIGHTNDNDGLLILVCWYNGDTAQRSVEQWYGAGLNWVLSPTKTDQVARDYFIPAFQEDRPGSGLVQMINQYDVLLRTPVISTKPVESTVQTENNMVSWEQILFLMLVVVIVIAALERFRSGSSDWNRERSYYGDGYGHSSRDGGGFDGGSSGGGGGSSTGF